MASNSRVTARPTQFAGLGYYSWGSQGWQFCQLPWDGQGGIGGWYPTKELLLADCHRFAAERGFTDREPPCPRCLGHSDRARELHANLEMVREWAAKIVTQVGAVLGDE